MKHQQRKLLLSKHLKLLLKFNQKSMHNKLLLTLLLKMQLTLKLMQTQLTKLLLLLKQTLILQPKQSKTLKLTLLTQHQKTSQQTKLIKQLTLLTKLQTLLKQMKSTLKLNHKFKLSLTHKLLLIQHKQKKTPLMLLSLLKKLT
ncbi:TPA: hypothetical protein ACGOVQ_000087 [Streptococcus suis]